VSVSMAQERFDGNAFWTGLDFMEFSNKVSFRSSLRRRI